MTVRNFLIAGAAVLPLALAIPVHAQAAPTDEQFPMNDARSDGDMERPFDQGRDDADDSYFGDDDRAEYDSERRYSSREMDERAITDDLNEQSLEDARS